MRQPTASFVRTLLAAPGGSIRLETVDGATARFPRSSTSRRRPAGTSARRTTYGVGFAGHEPLRPLVDHDPDLGRWTVPVAARRLPGGGRPDPRRRDRVGALPVPRGRRPDPAPRRAPLLQAPRTRAGRRGRVARRRAGVRLARLRRLLQLPTGSPTPKPARRRSVSRPTRRAGARPHDPARAGARLEPPQRHRRRLCRASVSLRATRASPR